jgi:cytochrome b561
MAPTVYTASQKWLHWSIFGLVLVMYALTFGEDLVPRGDPRADTAWHIHIALGILFAGLVAIRVAVRLARGAPALPDAVTGPERFVAQAGHLLLYMLLVALPVLGFLLTWYRGDALSFFGLFTIPSPVAPDRAVARSIKGLHSLCANGILIVAGLHAVAALWHHYIRHDGILRRMLSDGGR